MPDEIINYLGALNKLHVEFAFQEKIDRKDNQ